ncbi:uncharacterized protein LOC131633199 [Vicia villosa]|uniref:uncharacterized protein LOC131633199 n=1 Tax=Vicia villosa TaxID=3911 RepID=UPI00273CEC56|nr:uncharacterized protein LOC131633199 [Vicia villosa]
MSTNDRILTNLLIPDSKNYDKWSKQMKVLFGYQEVLDIVNNGVTPLGDEPTAAHQATFKEEKKKDYKALFLIHSCVHGDNFEKVSDCESTRQAWVSMEKAYGGAAKAKVVRFDNIIVAIERLKDLATLSKDELQSSLKAHEQRMGERGNYKANAEIALQARFNEKSKGSKGKWASKEKQRSQNYVGGDSQNSKVSMGQKGESSNSNGYGDRSNAKGGKPRDMSKIQCRDCKKLGHFQEKCDAKQWESKGDEAKVARKEVDDEDTLLMMITEKFGGNTEVLDRSCKSRDISCSSAENRTDLCSKLNVIISGKKHKGSFNKDAGHRTKAHLEVVYSNVCGPMQVDTLGGNRYFVTFIEDFSRKLWTYIFKRKYDVFDVFKRFKSMVGRQYGHKLYILKMDGGDEYTSVVFGKYYDDEGIVREIVPPYTPQQNGIAKRTNRSVMNMV